MALLTLEQLKSYLRIETDDEDTAVTLILANAKGLVEWYLGRPITAAEVTVIDNAEGACVTRLIPGISPVDTEADITLTDGDGVAVDTDLWRFDPLTQSIVAVETVFTNGPYTITLTAGLSARDDYATVVEPALNQAIADVAADLWRRRVASVRQTSAGGGESETYDLTTPEALPARTRLLLDSFRRKAL